MIDPSRLDSISIACANGGAQTVRRCESLARSCGDVIAANAIRTEFPAAFLAVEPELAAKRCDAWMRASYPDAPAVDWVAVVTGAVNG